MSVLLYGNGNKTKKTYIFVLKKIINSCKTIPLDAESHDIGKLTVRADEF